MDTSNFKKEVHLRVNVRGIKKCDKSPQNGEKKIDKLNWGHSIGLLQSLAANFILKEENNGKEQWIDCKRF